jgi:hypothetical protein
MSENQGIVDNRIICNDSFGTIKYIGKLEGTNEGMFFF